ncbi:MAG: zf-HC2 domain-containing protein [Pyrinomonadaceae bacterium]|nr:zf-HC2 domain-containing protein [Pyrinomonadaceae bacterium]
MRECLEEGIIQAYVDGELSPEAAEKVTAHANACAACAALIAEAENELALLATAFEPELSLPVPSERLRERLDAVIGEARLQASAHERAQKWNPFGWLSSFASSLHVAPRYAMGFASLLAVVGFAAIFALVASRQNEGQQLVSERQGMNLNAGIQPVQKITTPVERVDIVRVSQPQTNYGKARRAVSSPKMPSVVNNAAESSVAESKPLPGELNYLKTIASLSSIIETNGENALRPSLRSDYERNLALVNQAIDATRRTARRNPKNQDAAEFLYSSYQSKIDLLSAVAEQGQMVAALR